MRDKPNQVLSLPVFQLQVKHKATERKKKEESKKKKKLQSVLTLRKMNKIRMTRS